ncbi:hypothetical protein HPP92_022863 [Vanilla planifolia]|uniref:Condensin complex subunit 2 n=1 Tax=Vanilla planifolia TaxID=51239 RepID=A0A835PW60_VANPL|nr:hypothetical protein HPP92_022863 [Vanilla planifolia]
MPPAEDGSKTPTVSKSGLARLTARTPMASRLQSPTLNPFPLGSNDDELERAQARAARAASIRRKSAAAVVPSCLPSRVDLLDHEQIMDLLNNCLKLASENKINQKNTWELNLIDHLSEIIQVKTEEDDAETNFQKASCTLEAGVKIYSLRVDSLHSEAYKVLGGINRVGREEEIENVAEGNQMHDRTEQEGLSKKITERKLSPLSTLEASFEALNIKKLDVAFTVDPLYHQTSAQFDEGGAKGLLLNNLGVYGGCRVLFDSFEVPEKCIFNDTHHENSELIDLSFAKEYIDQMLINMPNKAHISPTLREIIEQFGENNHTLQTVSSADEPQISHSGIDDMDHPELEGNSFGDCFSDAFDHDDHINALPENSTSVYPSFPSHAEEIGESLVDYHDANIGLEEVTDFLSLGLGFTSKCNAWAGPDYWKYKKSKGAEQISNLEDKKEMTKKAKVKKTSSDIDFAKSFDKEYPDMFAPPKNPRSLLLPSNRATCNITLPEDCHYKPQSLAKLFLLPDVMVFGKRSRKLHDVPEETNKHENPYESLDQENILDDQYDNENSDCDVETSESLVHLPRQVNKMDIQYDKVSKQVDVHALKESLWTHIQETVEEKEVSVSMKQVLQRYHRSFSEDAEKDISPHLFFICLLHLANEHCLTLHHHPSLDDVDIGFPTSASVK